MPTGGKFGAIKRQHGRVHGLDAVLDRLLADCPGVTRIVPGRMGRKKGKTAAALRVQYVTHAPDGTRATGLKCLYTHAGSWQEVFLVTSAPADARAWIEHAYPRPDR